MVCLKVSGLVFVILLNIRWCLRVCWVRLLNLIWWCFGIFVDKVLGG